MKAIVCFSGGIDSTVVLAQLISKQPNDTITALFFDYGQKHIRERDSAERICKHYGIGLKVVSIPKAFEFYKGGLLAKNKSKTNYELKHRNSVLFSLALTYGLTNYPKEHIEIYSGLFGGYSDCSPDYIQATNKWLTAITDGQVEIKAPLLGMVKADVLRLGIELSAPIFDTWSCLNGGERECGRCPACIDKIHAKRMLGLVEGISEY